MLLLRAKPTASEYLRVLSEAGMLESKKIKQWIFYKRSETGIKAAKARLGEVL